ncbi:CoA transferase [Streptomyces sp. V3I7]|uniref:CoA transferase n=1 Tax=Streptomyces sp. V3I7 TaxID=3042278 RepID=UPI00278479F2|nr:CoA transferase [Streptomyces sp. V3I7]MDQ0994379.1 crotonobetainyl-CoA:carnitine CoA-transferase CaiB-like acyl-CoA transferase [Streptomyces sp. V3I7]
MSLAAPDLAPDLAAPPTTAGQVASRMLDLVNDPRTATVPYRIDWSGPVGLPLPDEAAVQAACGIMAVHGRAAGQPVPLAVDYASTVAGVLAAQGVCAALLARTRGTAEHEAVQTSVAQAALLSLTQHLAAATAEGEEAPAPGSGGGTLVSGDGVRYELEALDAERWLGFWRRLGAPPADIQRGWRPFQERFGTAVCALPPALHRASRAASYDVVKAAAREAGADVLPVREEPNSPACPPPWSLTPLPGPAAPARHDGTPSRSGPLAGVRVVESTRRVQGPLAGHLLRLLGASVVRVEPPGGDPMRGIPPLAGACSARFRALNDGKDVVEADITTTAGRAAVRELVADAHVFLHNWAPGKAAQLCLDADDLAAVRPGLVHAWASGWGDALGPTPPVGTDFLVQAHSGLAAALRPAQERPAPSLMTLTDVLGGLVSAQAVLAALLAVARGRVGRRVDSSLFSAAGVVPRPQRRVTWKRWDKPLATADGYLLLGADAREHPHRTAQVTGLGSAASVESRLLNKPSALWSSRFAEAGLTATPVCTDLAALAKDPCFTGALTTDMYTRPLSPWTFT